jgi:NADH-quinone oxidoreductase subunit H
MISYEISLGLSLVPIVMLTQSFSLSEIVNGQSVLPYGLVQPVSLVLFFISAVAEIKRIPFDLPEGENEIVAGYHTEYSGMRFAMYFLGEYANLLSMSALITLLYLGGWNVPWPSPVWLSPLWFLIKVCAIVFFMMWTRGTLPRFRFDQLMQFGWKVLLPLALLNVAVTALVVALRS